MRFILIIVAIFAVTFAGCKSGGEGTHPRAGKIPRLEPAAAEAAGLGPSEASEANRLFVAKCVRCHKAYDPASYDDSEWRSWMVKMSKKSRLKPDQEALLNRYLDAYRMAQKKTGQGSPP